MAIFPTTPLTLLGSGGSMKKKVPIYNTAYPRLKLASSFPSPIPFEFYPVRLSHVYIGEIPRENHFFDKLPERNSFFGTFFLWKKFSDHG